jgi:hypothetical protein
MRTSIKDSTWKSDPLCLSKNLRSLPVPFLEDPNKIAEHLKVHILLEKIEKTSLPATRGGKCLPSIYKPLKLITLRTYSVISFNNFFQDTYE